MSFGEHLEELRARVIRSLIAIVVALAVALVFGMRLVSFLTHPILQALSDNGFEPRVLARTIQEPFAIYMRISLIAGFVLASPYVFWQFWQFIAAGLYPHERRYVYVFFPFTVALFLSGTVFCYALAIRYGLGFLAGVAKKLSEYGTPLDFLPSLYDSVNLVLNFSLIMGLVFQLPVVMFFLAMTGLVEVSTFKKQRRYFILAAFIIAAVVTPSTDPVTQIIMGVPLIVLYELGIQVSVLFARRTRLHPEG